VTTQCNVGGTDRVARISIGSILLGVGLLAPASKPLRIIAGILGAAGLATGISRYCPASQAFGRNTCDDGRGTRRVEFVS
jgi:hypothetical protein